MATGKSGLESNPMRTLVLITALLVCSGCSSLLYHPDRILYFTPSQGMIEYEDFQVLSTDGVQLYGWLLHANEKPAKGTVLHFHGNAQNISSHFINVVWLTELGYDVYVFDYRGYGLSTGKPSPRGTIDDGKAFIRYVQAQNPVRPVAVVAQSLGGAIAARTLAEMGEAVKIDLLLLDSTFMSYRKTGRRLMARGWLSWPFQWLALLVLSDEYAPEGHLHKIRVGKTIVAHGDSDYLIEFDLGKELYEALPEPKQFWRVNGGQHTQLFFWNDLSFRRKLVDELRGLDKRVLP